MCDRMIDEEFGSEIAFWTFFDITFVDGFSLHFTTIYVLLTLRPVCYFPFSFFLSNENIRFLNWKNDS